MRTVFFDVDTQLDFLFPAGALPVPGGQELAGPLRALTQYAITQNIPVIATVDAHTENDPEFQVWPPHCVMGSTGQIKASFTRVDKTVTLPNAIPSDSLLQQAVAARHITLEKQSVDCFTSAALMPLLDALQADRYVVYGVVAEVCVARAIFGLLRGGKPVHLMKEAIKPLDHMAMEQMIGEFRENGGKVAGLNEVMAFHAE